MWCERNRNHCSLHVSTPNDSFVHTDPKSHQGTPAFVRFCFLRVRAGLFSTVCDSCYTPPLSPHQTLTPLEAANERHRVWPKVPTGAVSLENETRPAHGFVGEVFLQPVALQSTQTSRVPTARRGPLSDAKEFDAATTVHTSSTNTGDKWTANPLRSGRAFHPQWPAQRLVKKPIQGVYPLL